MTDSERLVLQGRAQIVLLILILVVLVWQGGGGEMSGETIAQIGAAGAAVAYALNALVRKGEQS